MADRKAIQLQDGAGNLYDIKDAEARENIDLLQSAIRVSTGNEEITGWSENHKYIDLHSSTANINSPVTQNVNIHYVVVSVSPGDKFTINSTGGGDARAYGFLSSNGTVLQVSESNATLDNVVVIAPANSVYLVINDKSLTKKSYYGVLIQDRVAENENKIATGELFTDTSLWLNAGLSNTGAIQTTSTNRVTMRDRVIAPYDIVITEIDSAFYALIYNYSTSTYANVTIPYTITKGTEFRLMIRRATEVSETADKALFRSKITIYVPIIKKIADDIKTAQNEIDGIEADVVAVLSGVSAKNTDDWRTGTLDNSGNVSSKDNRVCMKEKATAAYDIVVKSVDTSFYVFLYDYTAGGGLQTIVPQFIIPKNHQYRIMVRRVSEITETANISTFIAAFDTYVQTMSEAYETFEQKPATVGTPFETINQPKTFIRCFQNIGCIGDSLTAGGFNTTSPDTNGVVISEYSPPAFIKKLTGVDTVNLGISGAHATQQQTTYSYIDNAITNGWINNGAFVGDAVCDAYYIALGTNDIGRFNSFTGDPSTDINTSDPSQNANTSCGGYGKIISYIKAAQPKAPIFLVCISNTRNDETTRTEANTKIKAIAALFTNCYVIDLQTYAETTQAEAQYFMNYYKNNSHNNALGYEVRANQVATYIDYLIKTNISAFQNIQFIGTNYDYVGT